MQKTETRKTERINSTIEADLEKEFRETVYNTIGFKKGNLQIALEQAIRAWIDLQNKKASKHG